VVEGRLGSEGKVEVEWRVFLLEKERKSAELRS
jgi:hypothetical protein